MSGQAYQGATQRTFAQALAHLLETEYQIVGSGRLIQLLVADVQALVTTFYPPPEHLSPGWMLFTGIKAQGGKAYPGQTAHAQELVTLPWPVCLLEDIQTLATAPNGEPGKQVRRQLAQTRLVRLIEHGWQHPDGPVLLTLADLSLMTGLSTVQVSELLTEARQTTGQPLPTMGYYFDLGMKPTHKAEIVAAYEQGLDEAEVAARSQHAQSSVGRYLRDYERVKLALQNHLPEPQIPSLLGMQPAVVRAYLALVTQYHPALRPAETAPPPAP
jgi:hypothetical protein